MRGRATGGVRTSPRLRGFRRLDGHSSAALDQPPDSSSGRPTSRGTAPPRTHRPRCRSALPGAARRRDSLPWRFTDVELGVARRRASTEASRPAARALPQACRRTLVDGLAMSCALAVARGARTLLRGHGAAPPAHSSQPDECCRRAAAQRRRWLIGIRTARREGADRDNQRRPGR